MSSAAAQLDMFRQLVEAGSIGACARRVGQPPEVIADAIAGLESRLGHGLVEIDGGRVKLTSVGERTWQALQALEEQGEAPVAQHEAPPPAARPKKQPRRNIRAIRVACSDMLLRSMGERFAAFEDAHRNVAIELDRDSLTPSAIARGFATGRIDLALFHSITAPAGPPSAYLWSEPLSLFVSRDHPLAALDYVSAHDLAGVAPILPSPASPQRSLIEGAMHRAGFGAASPALESDDLEERFTALVDPLSWDAPPFLPLFGYEAQQFAGSDGIMRLRIATHMAAIEVRCAICPGLEGDAQVHALFAAIQGQDEAVG